MQDVKAAQRADPAAGGRATRSALPALRKIRGRLARAIRDRHLRRADMAARELDTISLADAPLLWCRRFDICALRWAVLAHDKEANMRRVLVLLAAAATLLVLAAGPAAADPGNKNTLGFTLNCGSAGTVDAVFELSSSDSFHIVQFSSNFLWKSLDYVTPDGQTGRIERGINGGGHSGLVTCTYIGAVSGNHYTVTGFFTP
jgi:hypothetical protein